MLWQNSALALASEVVAAVVVEVDAGADVVEAEVEEDAVGGRSVK